MSGFHLLQLHYQQSPRPKISLSKDLMLRSPQPAFRDQNEPKVCALRLIHAWLKLRRLDYYQTWTMWSLHLTRLSFDQLGPWSGCGQGLAAQVAFGLANFCAMDVCTMKPWAAHTSWVLGSMQPVGWAGKLLLWAPLIQVANMSFSAWLQLAFPWKIPVLTCNALPQQNCGHRHMERMRKSTQLYQQQYVS